MIRRMLPALFATSALLGVPAVFAPAAHATKPAAKVPAVAVPAPGWTMVKASEPWVREAPPTATLMAAYVTLENPSTDDLEVVGASSPQFQAVQLHEIVEVDGMTKMQEAKSLALPAKGTLVFKPGSTHVMLITPLKPLKPGDVVEIVFKFAKGGKKTVKAPVRPRH